MRPFDVVAGFSSCKAPCYDQHKALYTVYIALHAAYKVGSKRPGINASSAKKRGKRN